MGNRTKGPWIPYVRKQSREGVRGKHPSERGRYYRVWRLAGAPRRPSI